MKIARVTQKHGRHYYVQDLEERNPKTGRPKQIWHRLTRVSEGDKALLDALSALLGTVPGDGHGNMKAKIGEYLKVKLPELTPGVRTEYQRILEKVGDAFAEFDVPEIRPGDVLEYLNKEFADKPGAKRHYKARISGFFSWCILQDLCQVNPCSEVKLKREPKRKTKWTDKLFHDVRDRLSPMHQCYHDLSFLLYQRTTDVRLLKRSQIRDGVIHFEPSKTIRSSGKEVDIPITPAIQAVLDRAAEISRNWKVVCAYVLHTRGGTAYTPTGIYSAYKRADEQIHGMGNRVGLNPKALRPYAATSAKKQGYDLAQLQVGLAHTSVKTTEGYVHQHEVPVSAISLALPQRAKQT
jgi:integrase